jgi:ferric-dicitrate binding protein FerR (iron transport regulator)
MNKRRLALLLKKYLNNKASDEEKRIVDNWIKRKQHEHYVTQDSDSMVFKKKLKAKIDHKIVQNIYRRVNTMILSSFLLVVLSTLSIQYYFGETDANNKQENYLINVPKGEKMRIKLVDGSTVWLNAESRFEYPKTFDNKTRNVNLLRGEAFFDIATDRARPFTVETNASKTQVLGTTFNVQVDKSDKAVITLVKGAVRVSAKNVSITTRDIYLKPNEQAVLEKNGLPSKKVVNVSHIIGWNRLYFNNHPLQEAVKVLTKAYGIQIVLKDKGLYDIKFSASFSLTDKPTDVIYELAKANNIKYKWEKQRVTLY